MLIKQKWLVFLLLMGILLAGLPICASAKEPTLSADYALLYDLDRHQFIWGKNHETSVHPASLTKVVTCLMAYERGQLNEKVVIGPEAHGTYIGSTLELQKGDLTTMHSLVKAAMIVSANDAAVGIGEHIGGNEESFAQLMTLRAVLAGATQTAFENANGYSAPNHLTTPWDLARLTDVAMHHPQFAKVAGTKVSSISLKRNNKQKAVDLQNTNKLLFSGPGYTGVKTGTTIKAGGCLLVSKLVEGRHILAVVLHSNRRYTDAEKMFAYYQEQLKAEQLVKQGQTITTITIDGERIPLKAERGLKVWQNPEAPQAYTTEVVLYPQALREAQQNWRVSSFGEVRVLLGKHLVCKSTLSGVISHKSRLMDIFS